MGDAAKYVRLAGSARVRHPEAKQISAAPDTEIIPITLLLRFPTRAPPMMSISDWMDVPSHKRKVLSASEFAKIYGADKEDMAAVLNFAASHDMTVLSTNAATRSIAVNCSVASARLAFGVQINRYKCPNPMVKGNATYEHLGYDSEIHLPSDVSSIITAVIGLDNRKIHAKPPQDFTGDPPPAGTSVALLVSECAQLYRFPQLPANAPAADVVIGIHAPGGGYLPKDIKEYFKNAPAGFQAPPVMHDANCVVGGTTYQNDTTNIDAEVSLDIQTSTTIAQGCTANVYHTQDTEQGWVVFMNRVLSPPPGEKQPQVLTTSYPLDRGEKFVGDPTNPASQSGVMTVLFQSLANQGINVFASCGDYGSEDLQTDGKAHIQYPASDPWVTAVGGTTIGNTKNGPSGNFSDGTFDEYVWSDVGNSASNFFISGAFGATGGGVSSLFGRPSYQSALTIKDSTGATVNGRAIPDIAGMVACHGYVVNGATDQTLIGTSITTPMYAGFFAVLRAAFGQAFGPLNPLLYTIGAAFPQAYKDTIVGDNDSGPGVPFFTAGTGWDAASGWGSMIGPNMEDALAHLLYPKNFYITVRKNSFGLDEEAGGKVTSAVAASPSHVASYQSFWLVLEGYSPNQLPSTPPKVESLLLSPGSVDISVGSPIVEIQSLSNTPQRILYPCTITFSSAAVHATNDPVTPGVFPPGGAAPKATTIVAGINIDGGIEAAGEIELTPGANPYFVNVVPNPNSTGANAWYLSEDLRVFTTTPGALSSGQRPINDPASPTFPAGSGTIRSATSGYSYIQSLLAYLNTTYGNPNSTDPFTLLPGQNNALSSDSSTSPSSNGQINYNFAIARVRINGPSTKPIKVYFRLFVSNTSDTDFNPSTTYLTTGGSPSIGADVITIPMFATGNYQANSDFGVNHDYTQPSSNNFSVNGSGDHWAYFGCYLNLYPAANTIPVNGQNVSVSSRLTGTHNCLVAQIDFADAPIVSINGMNAGPENSDKLAQRNLCVTLSDNPGPDDTHRIPQTFDIRPSVPADSSDPLSYLPDELRIDWGNTPPGSTASIYWPQTNVQDIVATSKRLYATHQLSTSLTEANTLQCAVPAGGFTYIPIPLGSGENFAGLFTIQLPQGIVRGQDFLINVDRISSRQPPEIITIKVAARSPIKVSTNWRYVTGTFAVRIPVAMPSEILPSELDTYSILAWRLNQLLPTDRWYPVLQRYLSYINARVIGLGFTGTITPSPEGVPPGTLPSPCPCMHHHHHRHHHCCCEPGATEHGGHHAHEPTHHHHCCEGGHAQCGGHSGHCGHEHEQQHHHCHHCSGTGTKKHCGHCRHASPGSPHCWYASHE